MVWLIAKQLMLRAYRDEMTYLIYMGDLGELMGKIWNTLILFWIKI